MGHLLLRNGQKSKRLINRLPHLILSLCLGVGIVCFGVDTSQAFAVKLVKYLFEIKGGPGYPFNQPTDLAVGKGGSIYVLDGVNARVQVFDSQGKFLFLFGKPGTKDGEFNMPVGLDADRQGNIYIADTRNHRIQVFNADGHYLDKIILPRKGIAQAPDPVDVLVLSPHDESGVIFVTDNDNHRVLIYDKKSYKLLHQFGARGFEDEVGSFRYPFSLAADAGFNKVFVVDVLNTRVQVFDREGKFIRKIGAWGIREGTFFRPKGVTTDVDDNIYVSDSYMGVIQIFRPDGSYASVIGTKKGKEKKFNTPIRIYIDQKQRLFVVEELAHKVSVYSLL